jgi:hypothetical protein
MSYQVHLNDFVKNYDKHSSILKKVFLLQSATSDFTVKITVHNYKCYADTVTLGIFWMNNYRLWSPILIWNLSNFPSHQPLTGAPCCLHATFCTVFNTVLMRAQYLNPGANSSHGMRENPATQSLQSPKSVLYFTLMMARMEQYSS